MPSMSFDCLSELEAAWATDLLMGDFFHLTCPFLFILDTVAYFPVLRGRHSFDALQKIRDTTQLFLDVFTEEEENLTEEHRGGKTRSAGSESCRFGGRIRPGNRDCLHVCPPAQGLAAGDGGNDAAPSLRPADRVF